MIVGVVVAVVFVVAIIVLDLFCGRQLFYWSFALLFVVVCFIATVEN